MLHSMKKKIKSFVEVSNETEIATVVADFVGHLPEGEYLMAIEVHRGKLESGEFVFGVEFETFVGELKTN